MIGDELAQSDILAKLKTITSVTSLLGDGTSGIKEIQWQGDSFTYPNVRLDLETNEYVFDEQERCQLQYVEFSVYIFSQERSSKQCSQIKSLLANALIGAGFTGTNARYIRIRLVDNIPAVREDRLTWRSHIKLSTQLHPL